MTPRTNLPDSAPSRRRFLMASGAAATVAASPPMASLAASVVQTDLDNAPDLFSTLLPVQPQPEAQADSDITAQTIAHAQRLAGLEFTPAECEMMLPGLKRAIAGYQQRRQTVHPNTLAPALIFHPAQPPSAQRAAVFTRSADQTPPLPRKDEDIAFASVRTLSRWIEKRELTSERLTRIYLDRIKSIGPRLECIITITEDLALAQSRRADQEIAAGNYRGPLHGIPWGAKDLFDTAGIPTTWGATPYKDRVPDSDAFVVNQLENAGAVLIAKTTLGALAYGDRWFDGRTNNPFNTRQGSSGSSAGSAAGTAAGLFGFSLGTETLGSIVSPSMRCGTTGLRPTFGRVARTGAMALCWSLDKIGPICRRVEDCALVLNAINGADPGDPSSVDVPFYFDATQPITDFTVGYDPQWFEGRAANDIDRQALEALKQTGVKLVHVQLPDWDYSSLRAILTVEAAAAFEELTLTNRDDELVWQEPAAWPNTFREAWMIPAIELVQAQRFRRKVGEMMNDTFANVDALFGPSFAASLLLITNNTGHPSITLRAGFTEQDRPHGVTLWGNLFDEGTICRIAIELEQALGAWSVRPDLA